MSVDPRSVLHHLDPLFRVSKESTRAPIRETPPREHTWKRSDQEIPSLDVSAGFWWMALLTYLWRWGELWTWWAGAYQDRGVWQLSEADRVCHSEVTGPCPFDG